MFTVAVLQGSAIVMVNSTLSAAFAGAKVDPVVVRPLVATVMVF